MSAQSNIDEAIHPHRKEYRKITYSFLTDKELDKTFKNYLADERFSIDSYKLTPKTSIKIVSILVDNVMVRDLEKGCPKLFEEVLKRHKK